TANATSPSNDSKKSRRLWNIVGVPLVSLPLVFLAGSAAIGIDMCRSNSSTSFWHRYGTRIEFQDGTLERWGNGRYKTGIVAEDFEFSYEMGNRRLDLKVLPGKRLMLDSDGNVDFERGDYANSQPYTEAVLASAIRIKNIEIPEGAGMRVETDGSIILSTDELTIPYQKYGHNTSFKLRSTTESGAVKIKLGKNGQLDEISGELAEDFIAPHKLGETILKIRLPEKLMIRFDGNIDDVNWPHIKQRRYHEQNESEPETYSPVTIYPVLAETTTLDDITINKGGEIAFEADGRIYVRMLSINDNIEYHKNGSGIILSGLGGLSTFSAFRHRVPETNGQPGIIFDKNGNISAINQVIVRSNDNDIFDKVAGIAMHLRVSMGTAVAKEANGHGLVIEWGTASLIEGANIGGIDIPNYSVIKKTNGGFSISAENAKITCRTENSGQINVSLKGRGRGGSKIKLNFDSNGRILNIENAATTNGTYYDAGTNVSFENGQLRINKWYYNNGRVMERLLQIDN
ncbi:MAG: hypothetical protein ABIJ10_06110, partial [Candidatus Micrarchaeota archaeon]